MLTLRLALIDQRGQRRRRIHRGDHSIEAEHLRLGATETSVKDGIERPVPPDRGRARQFIGGITAKRD
jgi:hypothetical protein